MHATDKIPRGVAALQEILNSAFRLGQLTPESVVQLLPQGVKHPRRQILGPGHRRRNQRQRIQFRI